jgi:hypothetical protein
MTVSKWTLARGALGLIAASAIAVCAYTAGREAEASADATATRTAVSTATTQAWRNETGYNLPGQASCNAMADDGFLALDPHSERLDGYVPATSRIDLYQADKSCTNGAILDFNLAEKSAGLPDRICRPDIDPLGMVAATGSSTCSAVAWQG